MNRERAPAVVAAKDPGTASSDPPEGERVEPARRRLLPRGRPGPALLVLAVLVVAGVALRIVALASWWPAATTLADSWPYASYAGSNPLTDPQHPAGYSALLAVVGVVSRDLAVTIVLQHLLGVVAALVMFAAVRRMTGSPWPGLLPAAVILLNADEIFLEHNIMSEGPFVLALALTLYAAVRAIDAPVPWWKWPTAAAVLAVVATVVRSAALFVVPIIALAVLLAGPRPWLRRWRAGAAVLGVAAVLLAGYATASQISNGRFEVGPAQGWHLYGRVAPFADCSQFTPPKGTERLCETRPANQRPGGDFYLYDPSSPAMRLYGPRPYAKHDGDLGAWARDVALAEPRIYTLTMWRDLKAWYVPTSRPYRFGSGGDLDPQLDWTAPTKGSEATLRDVHNGLETFYDPFTITKSASGVTFLHDYQRIFRFGATALAITTLLTLLGLVIGPKRSRIGAFLFGVGGLALLIAPVLSVYYVGRYAVPLAGPISAGAAIALWSLWRLEAARRRGARATPASVAAAGEPT